MARDRIVVNLDPLACETCAYIAEVRAAKPDLVKHFKTDIDRVWVELVVSNTSHRNCPVAFAKRAVVTKSRRTTGGSDDEQD